MNNETLYHAYCSHSDIFLPNNQSAKPSTVSLARSSFEKKYVLRNKKKKSLGASHMWFQLRREGRPPTAIYEMRFGQCRPAELEHGSASMDAVGAQWADRGPRAPHNLAHTGDKMKKKELPFILPDSTKGDFAASKE
ncbi:hypothetical protein TNCV_4415431 [Trichonephila clavipes]|uniref:Uncharacterized protein n=1 Tax=Trichonephila clavipes TaxID=2585209 RepID=A0A8X6S4F3_TRICX|nr:hypothetical protein TNCV_4415431 [Trichonephila clavipes]